MVIRQTEYSKSSLHRVIGLMSGTSLDGVDVACVVIRGEDENISVELEHFVTVPFTDEMRAGLLRLCQQASAAEIAVWNFQLGEIFAAAVLRLLEKSGLTANDIDLVGSHGQTICHLPDEGVTLQIGEAAVIAERTGITTVADFRVRDMAAGGQGAPLVPYADYLLLRHPSTHRIIQNIGGIANCTLLPANCKLDEVRAWDTGPGNMVIDECVQILTNDAQAFDKDGEIAEQGRVDEAWLGDLMKHAHFHRPPPATAGREQFGHFFAENFIREGNRRGLSTPDLIATATALTAESIAHAYRMFAAPFYVSSNLEIILGGGGAFNPTLRRMLQRRAAPHRVLTHEDLGLRSDAKEAIAFAMLAHATMMNWTNNVPSATGASHPVIMGKIVPA